MELRVLGPLEVVDDGGPVPLGRGRERTVLALLTVRRNEIVPLDVLVDELWPDDPPATARKVVQNAVSRLRQVLGRDRIARAGRGYQLRLAPGELDVEAFERFAREAQDAVAGGDTAGASATLSRALALWRGTPYADVAYEPGLRPEILRLEEQRLALLEDRFEAELRLGRHAAAVAELESLVEQHPLRERLRGELMLALYRCGRQADALDTYRRGRRALSDELGLEPGPTLRHLERAILGQEASLDLAAESDRTPVPAVTADRRQAQEERKLVSVLVVDAVGLVARLDSDDPEDILARLQPYHAVVREEATRFGGAVDRVVGPTVMAVFGVPRAHEDDAERAVRAALAIVDRLDLDARAAVETGEALVDLARATVGETVLAGEVVTRAALLRDDIPVGRVVVGERSRQAAGEVLELDEAHDLAVPGASAPVRRWLVRGVGGSVRASRTPFTGRAFELALLEQAFARTLRDATVQLVTITGQPGIGKTRLVAELRTLLEPQPSVWRQGRCLPYGEGVTFWALGEIVKGLAGIVESDDPEQAASKLEAATALVLGEPAQRDWIVSSLAPLVGAASTSQVGADERMETSFTAWRRFLEAIAANDPLVLVFEDLHWADEGLLDFVDEVADRVRDAPLLVLCTARPELLERRPDWGGGKANALTISLPPLSDDETGRVFAAVLEQPVVEADVHEALIRRAGGNPLYAEQFARVLTEIGSLEELPETVHGIIAARLDGLAPAEKALLQDAAVVGEVFWLGAIEAIGDASRQQAEELLFGLERKEFVQQTRGSSVAGEAEYSFRHVLLRDVAYGQILRAARGERHSRAAAWIESLGRPEDHAEMLAHHYLSALEYAKAAGRAEPALADRARLALRAAGDRALALASYAAAARFYNAALEVWPESDPDRVWLLVHAGRASHAADGSGIEFLERGFEELRSLGDTDGAAEVAVELARHSWLAGERDAAYAWIDRALELARRRGGSRARAYALVERAAYHLSAGEHPQAIRLARDALPLAEALGMDGSAATPRSSISYDLQVRALDVLGTSRAVSGDVGGLEDSKRAIELARERNAFSRLIVAERNLHFSQFFLGHLGAASEALRMYRRDVESYGSADQRRSSRGAEAHEAVLDGRWDEAALLLDEVVAEAESGAAHYEDPLWRVLRASIALARGDLEGASTGSEAALNRARKMKDAQVLAPVLAFRGIVLLEEGRREEGSKLASELLGRGSVLVPALTTVHPPVTPIEFAWLLRDLGREGELLSALASAPSTPWCNAARAIAKGDMADAVDLSARIGAPSVEAYMRLRAAQELARAGHRAEALDCLAPALAFVRKVGATRYLAQAEQVLAPSG